MAENNVLITSLLLLGALNAFTIEYYASTDNFTIYLFNEPLNAELLISSSPYAQRFYIYKPQLSVGLSSFNKLIEKITPIESFGIDIEQTSSLDHPGEVVILPTGAIPENLSNSSYYILIGISTMCFDSSELVLCKPSNILYSTEALPDEVTSSTLIHLLLYEPWHTYKTFNISKKWLFSAKPHNYSRLISYTPSLKAYSLRLPQVSGSALSAHPNQTINILSVQNSPEVLVTTFSEGYKKSVKTHTDNGLLRYSTSFEIPGDYVLLIKGKREEFHLIHIYNLSFAQEKDELLITLDGNPYNGIANILYKDGSRSAITISGGRLRLNPSYVSIEILNSTYELRPNQPTIQYVAVLIAIFFFFTVVYLSKPYKPSLYTIKFHEKVSINRHPLKVKVKDIIEAFEKANSRRGWSKTALYPEEIAEQISDQHSPNLVVEGPNIESILIKMDKEGVQHHNHIYSLKTWGDAKQLATMREIRDVLVLKGIKFKETKEGFKTRFGLITTSLEVKSFPAIVVFDSVSEKRNTISQQNLGTKRFSEVLLMERSGSLQFLTKKELREKL